MRARTKFLRLSKLRNLRETEQVAAVCYRMRGEEVEFLLVQTGGGRWIFPKGCVEPGLTHAQAAAVEAFEEAGVHGRIEEQAFSRYRVSRAGKRGSGKQTVSAHLCEVLRLGPPQERGRNRTWFTVEKSKRRLREDRSAEEGNELSRIVSRAVIHIAQSRNHPVPTSQSLSVRDKSHKDSLQQVNIEPPMPGQVHGRVEAFYARYIRRLRGNVDPWADSHPGSIFKSRPQLSATVAVMQKVIAIDQGRGRGKART
jgi:8-oxo-dGTP pyrophosphatase MutT (NUDIX family)